jgi:hypothetical protein
METRKKKNVFTTLKDEILSFIERYQVFTQQEIDQDNMDIDVETVSPPKYIEKLVSYF